MPTCDDVCFVVGLWLVAGSIILTLFQAASMVPAL